MLDQNIISFITQNNEHLKIVELNLKCYCYEKNKKNETHRQ